MSTATSRGAIVSVAVALVLLFAFTTALNSAYRAARRSRAQQRYQSGLELAREGRNREAVDEFSGAITFSHNNADYRLALVRSLISLGRWNEAENHLAELGEDDPTNSPVNFMRAQIAARASRDTDAILYYNRAIYGYWPDHAEQYRVMARFALIAILDRDRQPKRVLAELLQLADDVPPGDTTNRLRIAGILLSHGSPEHAADVFKSVLAVNPKDAAANDGLGRAQFAMGDFHAARNAFHAAARLQPDNQQVESALQMCQAALDMDPTQVHIGGAERFTRAQELLRRVLESAGKCTAVPPELSESAQNYLAANPRRRKDGDVPAMTTLAQELWKVRQDNCGQAVESDPALAILLTKLQKQ